MAYSFDIQTPVGTEHVVLPGLSEDEAKARIAVLIQKEWQNDDSPHNVSLETVMFSDGVEISTFTVRV